jgi:OOP family OmpA-OmpF porin
VRIPQQSATHGRRRVLRRGALALAAAALVAVAAASADESDGPGVTDLSLANPGSIRSEDIAQALAVPRGTRIEASAPPTVRLPIYFEFNSATLRPEARELLAQVGAALASGELESFRFSIEGHTDAVGSSEYNQALSAERARAVEAFLVAEGVTASRLRTLGHGESTPVASNDSDEGRRRNRRVELVNLGGASQ